MSIEAVAEVRGHVLNRSNSGGVMNWLGVVPDGWSLLANKYIFKLRKVLVGNRHAEHELLSLTLNGVIKRDMENPEGKFPAEFNTYQVVRPGDFVFCLFDVEETPRTVGFSRHHGMITGAYTVLEVQEGFDGAFLYYFYLNLDSGKRLRHLYRGLRNTIPKETFFGFKSFIPPLPEQTRIAAFLDRKCGHIDQAIAQKERLISLLKERRQVLVQQAVTKGLDPKAMMKDSGVGWLGEVPAHWRMVRIKHMAKGPGSLFMDGDWIESPVITEDGLRYITTGNVGAGDYKEQGGGHISEDTFRRLRCTEVFPGDLLISRLNEPIGRACIIPNLGKRIVTAVDNVILRPSEEYYKPYLMHFMNSPAYTKYTSLLGRGATMSRISRSQLGDIPIAVPPKDEQIAIANYLDGLKEKGQRVDRMVSDQIAKLKEYRSILINAAVTGRIKVPEE